MASDRNLETSWVTPTHQASEKIHQVGREGLKHTLTLSPIPIQQHTARVEFKNLSFSLGHLVPQNVRLPPEGRAPKIPSSESQQFCCSWDSQDYSKQKSSCERADTLPAGISPVQRERAKNVHLPVFPEKCPSPIFPWKMSISQFCTV